jgi:hypothetical protein
MHFFSDKTDRYHVNFEQLKCLTVCVAFFQLYYANSTSVTCTNERMSTGLCIEYGTYIKNVKINCQQENYTHCV